MTLVLGTIELVRRANWALFRLEWEQIRRASVDAVESETCATVDSEAQQQRLRTPLLPEALKPPSPSKEARIRGALEGNRQRMARLSSELHELSR